MNIFDVLTIVILTLLPGFEGRYAIIYAISRGIDYYLAYSVTVILTIVETFLLITLLSKIEEIILNSKSLMWLKSLYVKYIHRLRKNSIKYLRYGYVGLLIYTAIPIPCSGVWTSSIIAHIFGFNKLKSFLIISIGSMISMLITSLIMFGILKLI